MRINLMDGSLRKLGGHPHDIDLRVAKALVEAGHDVHVYCHVDATEELKSHYLHVAPITPLFTCNPYTPPGTFDAVAGDILKNLDGAHITAHELKKTRAADVWLWPSLYAHQLVACSLTKTRALISGCIHQPPDFFSAADTSWWRYGFLKARHAGMNLRIGSVEPETRYIYSPLTVDGEFHLFPFPNDGAENIVQHHTLTTIGIFGFQRQEKGGTFMRVLLQKLVADGYTVILHDSNPANTGLTDITGVTYLGHVQNLDEEIAKCDLVLAPYRPEAYRYRGSGIVMNALASGVPVVTPYGSAPGRLVEQTGAGTLFTHYTLNSVYAAVQAAVNNYPAIAHSAYEVSCRWKEQHGVMKFVDATLP